MLIFVGIFISTCLFYILSIELSLIFVLESKMEEKKRYGFLMVIGLLLLFLILMLCCIYMAST